LKFTAIDSLQSALRARYYIAEGGLATSLYLALKLNRRAEALPQFVEVH
jgi:hypothetical protein